MQLNRTILSLALLAVLGLYSAPGEAQAFEVRVSGNRPAVALAEFRPADWPRMALTDRRLLAPYLTEHGALVWDEPTRRQWVAYLSAESDEYLRAYASVAPISFRYPEPRERASRIARLRERENSDAARRVLDYHIAMERARAGDAVPVRSFESLCGFTEQSAGCLLARLRTAADEAARRPAVDPETLRRILALGRPFLSRTPLRPAYFLNAGFDLPDRLYALGLPLEAAILAERMTHEQTGPLAVRLRLRIPVYLASAGDFESALRFAAKLNARPDAEALNAWLDWLILAGRYREALNLITTNGAEKFITPAMTRRDDYWTGFKYSREGVRLRSAMLLYLAGDVKSSAEALELLKEMPGAGMGGEPARYFARLRVAQIILRENPELAHKIAEDISYVAQENRWLVLEYHSTILDGWAHLNSGRAYQAVINFIKARGILPAQLQEHSAEYSRLLGLLAARNQLAPRGDQSALIVEINELLQKKPYNQALYTLREWSPVESAPDFYLREAVRNLVARGADWDALNLLLEHARLRESFFAPGENPGGARGFVTSALWSQELRRFSYVNAAEYPLSTAARTGALRLLPRTGQRNLTPASFQRNAAYIFSFAVDGGRYVFLVSPAARGVALRSMYLKVEDAFAIASGCSYANQTDCEAFFPLFENLRRGLAPGLPVVYAHYSPEFDAAWDRLLFAQNRPALAHFYHAEPRAEAGRIRDARVFRPDGCAQPALGAGGQPVRDFEELFNSNGPAPRGVWLWPSELDARAAANGEERPVYLRKFICGDSRLRLWDLDRFYNGDDLDLVVYRRRADDARLDRAFARHFADHNASLLESAPGPADRDAAAVLGAAVRPGGSVLTAFLRGGYGSGGARLILPGIPR